MNTQLLVAFLVLAFILLDMWFDVWRLKFTVVIACLLVTTPGIVVGLQELLTAPRSIRKRITLAFCKLVYAEACEPALLRQRIEGQPLYRNPFYNFSVLCKHSQFLTYTESEPFANFEHQNWEGEFATIGFQSEQVLLDVVNDLGLESKLKPKFNKDEYELLDVTKKTLWKIAETGLPFLFRIRVNFPNTPVVLFYDSGTAKLKMRVNYDLLGEYREHAQLSSLDSLTFLVDTLLFIHHRERHCCFVLESYRKFRSGYQLHSTSLVELHRRICGGERIGFTPIMEGLKYIE